MEVLESRRLLSGEAIGNHKPTTTKTTEPAAIIGGSAVQRGETPWIVSLQNDSGHFCGGTLISPNAVVTAAHCVEGASTTAFVAVIGREDLSRGDGRQVTIAQILVHPNYDPEVNDADVAVLILTEVVAQSPLRFLTADDVAKASPGTVGVVLGWGMTREGGNTTQLLRQVPVPIVSNATANARQSYGGSVTDNMLAAGLHEGGSDSCQGDSGGPLVVGYDQAAPRLAGIVSWGEGCGRPDKYGIYTRVSMFAAWISDAIALEEAGRIDFAQDRFVAGEMAQVLLQDANLETIASVRVQLTSSSGDHETIELTSFSPGRFRGEVLLAQTEIVVDDGKLDVLGEEPIQASYADQDDGSGLPTTSTAFARVIVDDFANSVSDAFAVSAPATVRGDIEISGDVDWFVFPAQASHVYEITVALNGTLNDSLLEIRGVDGVTTLGFDDDSGRGLGSQLLFAPLETGSYLIAVSGYGGNIGSYELQLQSVAAPPDDHGNVLGTGTLLRVPASRPGVLDVTSDTDWFQFEAVAGMLYQIDVTLHGLPDSQVRLIDSDGRTELAFNDDADASTLASRIYHRADTGGMRYFEVAGYGGATGAYEVHVVTSTDDHANSAAAATPLGEITESTASRFGTISPQDTDWFAFAAHADAFYEIRTFLTTLEDSVLRIYGPDGQTLLASNDDQADSFASRLVWQADADGVYFAEVSAFRTQAGDYRIDLHRLEVPPNDDHGNRASLASQLEVPQTRLGRIHYDADVDWFQFDAVQGVSYSFQVELRSLEDSVLSLYDSDGVTLLASHDDLAFPDRSSRLDWTAAASGRMFLVVSAYDGFLGSYRLRTSATSILGDLNLDGVVDAHDIDALFAALPAGNDQPWLDLNEDQVVNQEDVDFLLQSILGTRRGDTNLDGAVNFTDFLQLARAFNRAGNWTDGDFDGTGTIAFEDFLTLANNFGDHDA